MERYLMIGYSDEDKDSIMIVSETVKDGHIQLLNDLRGAAAKSLLKQLTTPSLLPATRSPVEYINKEEFLEYLSELCNTKDTSAYGAQLMGNYDKMNEKLAERDFVKDIIAMVRSMATTK